MGELSIKLKIANRVYPLTVNTTEEEGVRKAADEINKAIAEFERLYSVKDYQDLLAMVALKFTSKNSQANVQNIGLESQIKESLSEIDQALSKYL
ncbi:MAG: cell division protein ZapA [Flavobacteriales bacterium]|nr:cell division protein ZapA [Flavobacteriales bacterium]